MILVFQDQLSIDYKKSLFEIEEIIEMGALVDYLHKVVCLHISLNPKLNETLVNVNLKLLG